MKRANVQTGRTRTSGCSDKAASAKASEHVPVQQDLAGEEAAKSSGTCKDGVCTVTWKPVRHAA